MFGGNNLKGNPEKNIGSYHWSVLSILGTDHGLGPWYQESFFDTTSPPSVFYCHATHIPAQVLQTLLVTLENDFVLL